MTYTRLNKAQTGSLLRWIKRLDALYIPPTGNMVMTSANAILRRANPEASCFAKDRIYHFVAKQLPSHLNWVHQKPADQRHITAEDIGGLAAWNERLEPLLKRIPPKNIYNFDETGFALFHAIYTVIEPIHLKEDCLLQALNVLRLMGG
jgi:hypothetical protein